MRRATKIPKHSGSDLMKIDFAKVELLPEIRQRAVRELLSLLDSCDSSPNDRRELYKMINEVIESSPVGRYVDPVDYVSSATGNKVAEFYHKVGERIRLVRVARRMSQDYLAGRAGIPQPHLCKIERGDHIPTRPTVLRIAKALGVSLDDLASAGALANETSPAKPTGRQREARKSRGGQKVIDLGPYLIPAPDDCLRRN